MIKLSEYVVSFLEELGVKHLFMISGGGCMHLVDSIGRSNKIDYICNLNEQAVSIAVEAYGQYTNHIGVGLVTTGPGGTNAITGIAAAYVDSTPCLIISGQVKRQDLGKKYGVRQMGFQEINITSIVNPITKYAVTVDDPKMIKYHLEKAIYLAKEGRPGPVWIDIPLDIQASMIDESALIEYKPKAKIHDDKLTSNKLDKLVTLLNDSKRPCILAGNGIRLANAEQEFLKLVNLLNIPVLTTWKAIDFFDENDTNYYGRPGAIGQRAANFIQQNCDLLVVIGARLDLGQTAYNHKNFAKAAKKVMIDIDSNEINKMNMQLEIKLVSDAKIFIKELLSNVSKIKDVDRKEWLKYCNLIKHKYPVILDQYWNQKEYVNPYCFIEVLSTLLNEKDIIVPGSSGSCSEITMQAFKIKKGQRLFNNEGFGAMGFGLPASIAACIASNKKRTICINGDGGFQFNIQEIETLRRHNLPLKIFIFNNDGYAAITNMQRNYFDSFYVGSEKNSEVSLPDICKVADAYNIRNVRINDNSELEEKVAEVLNIEGPVICDLMINPLQQTMPRVKSVKLPNGSMITKPMEDLWPFLEEEEFTNNMLCD
ncbi:thiamine pyrophosphate-binding protein [Vallitalea guaymasensis]|uniref:Thiamine pyrophosphate-binding protein n=1 Tax=Vallitalea guaymasensis TaxID=1185412 RepID=A0A8J8M9T4_9FIRM|nr:thiamine pyrophosphate-binding protein [Vallitalea guaymasensis]QUH28977.1 thiamine pyrophosphate-binding protein [Vallitalea guaymasensis]